MNDLIMVDTVYQRLRANLSAEQLDKLYQKIGFYLQDIKAENENTDDKQE